MKSPLKDRWNCLVLLRVEVVGEPVVVLLSEPVDHPADRAGLELVLGDVLEVVLLDERLRLVADGRLGDALARELEVEGDGRKRRGSADEESEEEA